MSKNNDSKIFVLNTLWPMWAERARGRGVEYGERVSMQVDNSLTISITVITHIITKKKHFFIEMTN